MIATTQSSQSGLVFNQEGAYPLSDMTWQDVELSVTYESIVSKIGLSPRYLNDNFYISSYIEKKENDYYFVTRMFLRGETTEVCNTKISTLTFPLTITCNVTGSHYRYLINNNTIAEFESLQIPNGKVMIYAGQGDKCTGASIKEPQAIGWMTNSADKEVIIKQTEEDDETQQFTLIGTPTKEAKVWRPIPSVNGALVLSFTSIGEGAVSYLGITNELKENKRYSFPITVATPKDIVISFATKKKLTIQEPQLENGLYATDYIPNNSFEPMTRKESVLSFPSQSNFRKEEGTMYLSIEPKTFLTAYTIFETDTKEFKLAYTGTNIEWTVCDAKVSIPMTWDSAKEIVCKWSQIGLSLSVNKKEAVGLIKTLPTASIKTLYFTKSEEVGFSVIDDIVIWSTEINEEIKTPLPSPDSILMKADFKKAISGKGVSWHEVPVSPLDKSPILVEKQNGDTMKKVSFFDLDTASYRTFNEELFVYNGKSDFVEVAFDNINEDYFDLMIRTESGEKIGGPYKVDGKRIWFTLSPSEKKLYNRKSLYVRYQINDSYTIDYNIEAPDGYRIDFSKHDGAKKTIYQEGNRYGEPYKLATMIEMNPIHNQNNEGFLYVTNNDYNTETFKITITPEGVPADGGSMSMVLIEPVDKDGNFVPTANLQVTASYGHIHRIPTVESAQAQKRSGMYIYQYYPPFLVQSGYKRNVEERIWIFDKDTGIGMEYSFFIKPMQKPHPIVFSQDEMTMANNKTILFDYMIMYEGMQEEEDPVLFSILDLNKDKKINEEDVLVMESGSVDKLIPSLVTRIKEWEVRK